MKLVDDTLLRRHIVLLHDEDNSLLDFYNKAASAAVLNHMKSDGTDYIDSSEDVVVELVPPEVQEAVLIMVHYFYNDRGGENSADWANGMLPPSVMALLRNHRDPTISYEES